MNFPSLGPWWPFGSFWHLEHVKTNYISIICIHPERDGHHVFASGWKTTQVMRIWPWRWHHGNSHGNSKDENPRLWQKWKATTIPNPQNPVKYHGITSKCMAKLIIKCAQRHNAKDFCSNTCSTASTVSHPLGCFWNILLCPGVVSFKGLFQGALWTSFSTR